MSNTWKLRTHERRPGVAAVCGWVSLQPIDSVHCYYRPTCKRVSFSNWPFVFCMDLQNIWLRNSVTQSGCGHRHSKQRSNVGHNNDFMMDGKWSCNKGTTDGTMKRSCRARKYQTSRGCVTMDAVSAIRPMVAMVATAASPKGLVYIGRRQHDKSIRLSWQRHCLKLAHERIPNFFSRWLPS